MFAGKRKPFFLHLVLILVLLGGMFGMSVVESAQAATLIVSNTNDSGAGSLRQAIFDATAGDIISFGAALSGQTIILGSTLTIDKDLSIDGSSLAVKITISGNSSVRLFQINPGVRVLLDSLALGKGTSTGYAGAIYNNGILVVVNSFFGGNSVSGPNNPPADGGAIFNNGGTLNITNSTFSGNSAVFDPNVVGGGYGGAIYSLSGALTITNSAFTGNTASRGGAIACESGTMTVTTTTFATNRASASGSGEGGAIFSGSNCVSDSTISNSTFLGNSATDYGGAIFSDNDANSFTVTNSTFHDNTATAGAGIFSAGQLRVTSSTFSENNSSNGETIRNGLGGVLSLRNSILANTVGGVDCSTSDGATIAENINNLIETNGADLNSCGTPLLTSDPLLGPFGSNGGPTQTMALTPGSPAIDAGDVSTCPSTDQRGVGRPQGAACDLGAYEVYQYTISGNAGVAGATLNYVDGTPQTSTTDTNGNYSFSVVEGWSGTVTPSKPNVTFTPVSKAYSNVLANQSSQDYTATINVMNVNDSGPGSLRQAINDAGLVGATIKFDSGLSGQTISVASQLIVNKNLTIDGSGLNPLLSISGNNSVRIFKLGAFKITIQSLILKDGNSTGSSSSDYYGGAIYTTNTFSSATNLTISNVKFLNNLAYQGGAVYVTGAAAITGSEFTNNGSEAAGGALYVERGDLTIKNSLFQGNTAAWTGGAIHFASGLQDLIEDTTFSNNAAVSGGGAILFDQRNNHDITIRKNLFSGNSSTGGYSSGGAIWISDTGAQGVQGILENNTFYGNSSAASGGGVASEGNFLLRNNTFSDNRADYSSGLGGGNLYMSAAKTVLYNNIFANNAGGQDCSALSSTTTGSNNLVEDGSSPCSTLPGTIIADPILSPLADNGGPTQTMALLAGSPAIDAADDLNCPMADQRGVTRPQGAHCDLGALEYVAPYSNKPLYLSFANGQTIGGVSSADEDILKFDGSNWSLFFDGSDVGVGSPDLFAFSIMDADTILMSFNANVTVNGIAATPQDVLRFDATSLGSTTAGVWSMYFDGSDVGFDDTTNEKIDSLSLLPDGRLLISTTGNPIVPGVSGARDEDVLAFAPTTLGTVTSGNWSMYFDGSDVGLADTSGEDVDALDVVGSNIYLSTQDNFSVNGVSGADEDVFVCAATSLGDVTACNYSPNLYFDGSTWGLAANDVDAFNFLDLKPAPTSTPTSTATSTATRSSTPTPTNTALPSATPTYTPTPGPGTILLFTATADSRVSEASPTTNYGTATTLQADAGAGVAQNSYIRFTTIGINEPIQSAKLRVFCTTNGTSNGPAAYLANSSWTESGTGGVTWNTKPGLLSGALDNKGAIATNTWVEYNVTALISSNGTYTFALVADSSDGIVFSSREGPMPPELLITLGTGGATATPTNTPGATFTPTFTPTATRTASPSPTATATQTTSAATFTFVPSADSYVDANNPTVNYGTLTTLRVDGSPIVRSYLRFNVQGLGGKVSRATLRIFANSASSSGIAANSVSDDTWTETTLNYNNAPPIGSALGLTGSVAAGTWVTIDITAYVTGNGTYNLVLTTPGSTAISLASRESGANAPQLVIETTP